MAKGGNYGSVDGDPAAAMECKECKLSPITESLLGDIEKETIDWVDNFDQSLKKTFGFACYITKSFS